ncbi:MAG: alpha/beta hydrolase [Chloroflexota bacterium]|nr:alpha/beta hydrolase [Chloroflexota bacterium]
MKPNVMPSLVVALFVAACSGAAPIASGSPDEQPTTATEASASPQALVGDFDVGDGRELHLECIGAGSPTIVIEVGNDDTIHGSWDTVFEPMSSVSRVCGYDRANLGRSDPHPGPRLISDLGDDLVSLLHAAEVPGPYVFVGGSFGGNLVSVLAADHPDEVAGMVFVDSDPVSDDPAIDPLRLNLTDEQYAACCADPSQYEPPYDAPENTEHIDWAASREAALASVDALPHVPTTVITAMHPDCEPDWPCEAIAESRAELQALWIAGNPDGRQVLIESGHVVQREAPNVIVDETRKIVETLRES